MNQNLEDTETNKTRLQSLRDFYKSYFYRIKKIKLVAITFVMILLTIVVSKATLEIGYTTSQFGATEHYTLSKLVEDVDSEFSTTVSKLLDRRNSIYIYYAMIVLLVLFNFVVLKRVWYIWVCYKEQNEIDKSIIQDSDNRYNNLRLISTQNYIGFPKRFISSLYNSFKIENSKTYFSQFYEDFLNRESDRTVSFIENTNKSMIWIIRLGIFGTLLGLLLAFFEMWVAMHQGINFDASSVSLNKTFIDQVKQSLLGNSIAVATSITAHGITLIIEFGVTILLRDETNETWLHETYSEFLKFEGFSSNPESVTNSIGKVNIVVATFSERIQSATEKIEQFSNENNKLISDITQLNNSVNEISDNFKLSNKEVSEFNKDIEKLNDKLEPLNSVIELFSDRIKQSEKELNNINKDFTSLNKKLNPLDSTLGNVSDKLHNSENGLTEVNRDLKLLEKELGGLVTSFKSLSDEITQYKSEIKDLKYSTKNLKMYITSTFDTLRIFSQDSINALQKGFSKIKDSFNNKA